jgi:aerobic carbon-monoxide dehydrogenase small subunit
VSVTAFLQDCPDPGDEQIREALSGNICRCTGYQGIVRAVRLAARLRHQECGGQG